MKNSEIKEKLIKSIERRMHELNQKTQPLQMEINRMQDDLDEKTIDLNVMLNEMSDLEKQKGWVMSHE